MEAEITSGPTGFAGRATESAVLRRALRDAAEGRPTAVHIHGEAGVGKTRLATEICREARESGQQVLWGRCLLLGSGTMPYQPFVTAFEDWLNHATDEDRHAALEAAPGLSVLVPSLGGRPTETAGHLTTVDRALAVLSARAPLVLVIDDVQWADATSRDVLSYLLVGLRGRILVLMTSRDEERRDGDPFRSWLADIRRVPVVRDVRLDRLTPDETAEQAALVLGREPDPELLTELLRRTQGNAYFNELLLRDVVPGSVTLPAGTPALLRDALLSGWHRLSGPARELTRLLAVAGRPTGSTVLRGAASDLGIGEPVVLPALREASEHGIVEATASDQLWFRHPLLAEVLQEGMLPGDRANAHRIVLRALTADRSDEPTNAELARHHEAAGNQDAAFAAWLDAADDALSVAAFAEEGAALLAAWRLRDAADPRSVAGGATWAPLAARVAFSARRGGAYLEAAQVLDEAREILPEEPDPLVRACVLRIWAQLAALRGESPGGAVAMAALQEALASARQAEPSGELAHVLAELAYGHLARGARGEAVQCADEAVAAARDARDEFVLSYAFGARSSIALAVQDLGRAAEDAESSIRAAQASGRPEAMGLAANAKASVLDATGQWSECAAVLISAHLQALERGVRGLGIQLGAIAAHVLCHLGRLGEADGILQRVLAFHPDSIVAVHARAAALRSALRQGRVPAAETHAGRILEQVPVPGAVTFPVSAVWCEYLIVIGRPEEAHQLLLEHLSGDDVRAAPQVGDELLVWSARAAAAVAAAEPSRAASWLDQAERQREQLEPPAFAAVADSPVTKAWQALYAAEAAVIRGAEDRAGRWRQAVATCDAAGLHYEAARSRLALVRTVAGDPAARSEAAALLRQVSADATAMGADPLTAEAETLARVSRIPLVEPVEAPAEVRSALDEAGLTPREREVLSYLVAGRTYAEIATALFISEKTVSVHVSNLLGKTGTTNRVDAAIWAERARVAAAAAPGAPVAGG